MDALLRRLMRTGFRRGMSGSRASQAWLVLGISALGFRALRRLARTDPEVVYRTEVHTGDRFEISSRKN
jgi:hypothetical protein